MKKLLIILILFLPIMAKAYNEAVIDVTNLTIREIQEYVDKGYISYEHLLEIYLDRIEVYNDMYNALITINENALEEAIALDLELQTTGRRSLIHGLPIIVKDNIDVIGMPTTNGCKGLENNFPKEDADVIKKLKDAGAIIIAKSNMSEFAFDASNSYSSYGHVYNAYNTDYSSYGSSGGTAVSIAASFAVAGIGTDTGASIRLPAAANNLIGLRPSFKSINMNGIINFEQTRDVAGPITKYVEDNAIILEIIDNAETNYVDNLINQDLSGIRIGVLKSVMNPNTSSTAIAFGKTDQFVYDLMLSAIDNLKSLNAEIVYVDSFYLNYMFDATTMCYDFNNYIKGTTGPITNFDDLIKTNNYVNPIASYGGYYCYNDYKNTEQYKSYINNRNNNVSIANKKFNDLKIDAMIYPSLKTEQLKITDLATKKLYTPISNFAPLVGFPALNLPIGFYNGLPYGMEILALENKEDIIYKIAYNFQEKFNYFNNPNIAPNLYEIPDNIEQVFEIYESEYPLEFSDLKNELAYFIENYHEFDNQEQLIDNYINDFLIINTEISQDNNNYAYLIMGAILGFLVIVLVYKGVKHEKTKRII